MPDVGRFFNVDVLAEDYDYQTPYAFSENKVTNHIELEGLEAVPIGPGGVPVAPPPPVYGGSTTGFHPVGRGMWTEVKGIAANTYNGFAKMANQNINQVNTIILAGSILANRVLNSESESDSKSKNNDGGKTKTKAEERAEKLSQKQRPGKDFTKAGKDAVKDLNREKNDGKTVCENCGVETVPGKKSERGVVPPKNETQVDHIKRKREGGSGTPDNGQVLCRSCNLDKH